MIKSLMTPAKVIELAYAGEQYTPDSAITQADILAAQQQYITPIVGESLMVALSNRRYDDMLDDYVVPALAECVRVVCNTPSAPVTKRVVLRARALLLLLSEHLEATAASYPEYESHENVLNRCSCNGGIVQIF